MLIRGARVSVRATRVLQRHLSGIAAAPEFERVEKKWPRPTSRRLTDSLVEERQAVPVEEEEVLGSIPALGTVESMPSYHHEHMYKEENLLALYELYSEGALDGYKEIGDKFRQTKAGYVSFLTWQLGPSGCTVTVEAEGASKKETKRIAIGKIIQHLPYDQSTMFWLWKKMCMDLEKAIGARSRSSSVLQSDGKKGYRCDIIWEKIGKDTKIWKGTGLGDSQEEAELRAMEDVYRTVTGTHNGDNQVASPDQSSTSVPSDGAVVLSTEQANSVMTAYNRLASRLVDSASVGLDSHITFGEGLSGTSATIGWTWTEGKEKKTLTASAEGSSKTMAKAAACLSVLEQYGAVKSLANNVWQDIEAVNSALDRGDVAEGNRVAGRLLRSAPVHGWPLFLVHLWRSILASSDSTSVDELLGNLRHRSEKNGGQGIVPVYLWEAMVDECANLSDHAFASSMLERFLSLVKCEAFSDHSVKYSHWRGLIGLERITSLQNALKEAQDAGERPFTATVSRDNSRFLTLRVLGYEAQGHDLSEGSLMMLFEPGAFYRRDTGDLVSILAVVDDCTNHGDETVLKLSLASREAELEAKSRESGLLSNEELSCLPLDDSNVSHSRMCEALRVLYEVPACDNALFLAVKPNAKLKGFDDGGGDDERFNYNESMRDALLRSAPPFEPPKEKLPDLGMPLSENQSTVINGCWNVPLTLIQGPPGTGKTYTAVAIVKHWVRNKIRPLKQKGTLGKNEGRILVVADSNAAADNIRSHLERNGVECYRVGRMTESQGFDLSETVEHYLRGHPLIKEYKKAVELGHLKRLPALRAQMDKIAVNRFPVIVGTCIGSGHPMLDGITFDSVVIDECTQATEPATLVPLARGAKRCVLLGDHKQLSATVCSTAAQDGGFGVSLFERLLNSGGRLHVLDVQRRMHPSIAEFSNINFYDGGISDAVGERPEIPGLFWPAAGVQVCLVDTNTLTGGEARVGTSYCNRTEAKAVVDAMVCAIEAGMDPKDIGIIVPYSGQKSEIEKALESDYRLSREQVRSVSVNTVDAFQGSEKELILFSAVRSNREGEIGFTGDPRRMNVMLTRARRGFVVFADVKTLTADPECDWSCWIHWAREKKCMVHMNEYFKKIKAVKEGVNAMHKKATGKSAEGFRVFPADMWTRDLASRQERSPLGSKIFKRNNAR